MNATGYTFRVSVDKIGSFLDVLDPEDSAIVTYKAGRDGNGEHYVVEVDIECDILGDGVERLS